ncbi:MAG: Rsd/AlgQ family anti-sigma factor [Gammaproteobacteria bacterium]|nr:MAG: Rsd/AlgQ family anti-sigma factor [Gammaproteobacteria bacterium]
MEATTGGTTDRDDKQGQERRGGSRDLIAKLTAERSEMLALFCRVAGLEPYEENPTANQTQEVMQEFCQVLVDYVAAGHFSLYERIINGQERRKSVAELAEKLYPDIARTTEISLDFNDKYDCEDNCPIGNDLNSDLSHLGEILATRIELEDKLIKALC